MANAHVMHLCWNYVRNFIDILYDGFWSCKVQYTKCDKIWGVYVDWTRWSWIGIKHRRIGSLITIYRWLMTVLWHLCRNVIISWQMYQKPWKRIHVILNKCCVDFCVNVTFWLLLSKAMKENTCHFRWKMSCGFIKNILNLCIG